jgi:hypothetical protein
LSPSLEEDPYELLIGRKSNIAYFRVFGCKCYILKKGTRLSKFEKKCDEEFLLGYSTISKEYRVYNKTHGIGEEVYDVEFDETNGSQVEDENLDDVRDAKLDEAMKYMAIGDIRPKEEQTQEDDSIRVVSSSSMQNQDQPSTSGTQHHDDQVQQVASPIQVTQSSDQPSSSNKVV